MLSPCKGRRPRKLASNATVHYHFMYGLTAHDRFYRLQKRLDLTSPVQLTAQLSIGAQH